MSKDSKPDAWMPRVRPGSSLRLEINVAEFLMRTMRLSASDVGHLQRMLMAEAALAPVSPAPNARVQEAFELRSEYSRIKGGFGRTTLPLRTRKAVFERDGGQCGYCGSSITWNEYHCDHVEPVSKGGSDALTNLRAACRPCNLSKAAKDPSEWAK